MKKIGILIVLIILILTNFSGCTEPTGTTVSYEPEAKFITSISGTTVYFTDKSTDKDGSIREYNWEFGDGDSYSSRSPGSHTYSKSGSYTVRLTVKDNDGNEDIYTQTVTVTIPNKKPTATCSAYPTSGTIPLTVSFTGSGKDSDGYINDYEWDFKDGTISSTQNPSHTFTTSGTYYVKFTVTDDDGAKDTDSVKINVLSDLDGDKIADGEDIYDYGDGAIKFSIDEYHCDQYTDEVFSNTPDTYFKIEVYSYKDGSSNYLGLWRNPTIHYDDIHLYNSYSFVVDVEDDVDKVYFDIEAWDDDVDDDDHIDLSGDSTATYATGTYFYPQSYNKKSFSDDGRLDLKDEQDGWIEYTIEVVKYKD